jgi:hypothetical protein
MEYLHTSLLKPLEKWLLGKKEETEDNIKMNPREIILANIRRMT